ncbi:MAG: hypothetical protein OEZ25_06350 [Candidatus Bathyarchaeota archaeon]|nr:hypothetical protein [Candidatus Bathyarchaeota archaeon]
MPLSTRRRKERKDGMTRGIIEEITKDTTRLMAKMITEYIKHSRKY